MNSVCGNRDLCPDRVAMHLNGVRVVKIIFNKAPAYVCCGRPGVNNGRRKLPATSVCNQAEFMSSTVDLHA